MCTHHFFNSLTAFWQYFSLLVWVCVYMHFYFAETFENEFQMLRHFVPN